MGYEVRLVLLDFRKDAHKVFGANAPYASTIGTLDLCKVGSEICDGIEKAELFGARVAFYLPGNGDEHVKTDMYGKKVKAFKAKRMLSILKKANDPDYRRFKMAIPLLEQFIEGFGENAYVGCFGH
jgi:hypothetical protein